MKPGLITIAIISLLLPRLNAQSRLEKIHFTKDSLAIESFELEKQILSSKN